MASVKRPDDVTTVRFLSSGAYPFLVGAGFRDVGTGFCGYVPPAKREDEVTWTHLPGFALLSPARTARAQKLGRAQVELFPDLHPMQWAIRCNFKAECLRERVQHSCQKLDVMRNIRAQQPETTPCVLMGCSLEYVSLHSVKCQL